MNSIRDVVVVGGGLAGLAAAWRLRHWDPLVLEADDRVGGRLKSERRGPYWLNWGGHVFAGPGTSTDALLTEVGVSAVTVPGSLKGMAMNGKLLTSGHIATYPLRIPMSARARAAIYTAGAKVGLSALRYNAMVRRHQGDSAANRQQHIYDFEDVRTFADLVGQLPADANSLFETVVTRSAGDMDEISAGCGVGYFSLVLFAGNGLNRGIVGGPSTLTESIHAALGDRVQLGAAVQEIVHRRDSVVVRYRRAGVDHEVQARTVVLAVPATVAHRVGVDLPADVREALGQVVYGPHVSTAFLTNETSSRPWDSTYAIAAPKSSFAIALNQASIVRGSEKQRLPGGSMMTFSPAGRARALLDKSDQEIVDIHLADLDAILGNGFASTVVEARSSRWVDGSPYRFPGRGALQPALMRGGSRVFLAGDYLGTLYTESAITTGFAAAQNAASICGTVRQQAGQPAHLAA
ncbi:MAG: flavin monoamine oxidase family protein [Actinomycetales bacterium]